jgi:hypothetical protein
MPEPRGEASKRDGFSDEKVPIVGIPDKVARIWSAAKTHSASLHILY